MHLKISDFEITISSEFALIIFWIMKQLSGPVFTDHSCCEQGWSLCFYDYYNLFMTGLLQKLIIMAILLIIMISLRVKSAFISII